MEKHSNLSPARVQDTKYGKTIFYKSRNIYSNYNPEQTTIRRISNIALKPQTLYFIPSPGLGYGIKELSEKLPKDSFLLCVEADPCLSEIINDETIGSQLPFLCKKYEHSLSLIHSTDPVFIVGQILKIGISKFRRINKLYLTGGVALLSNKYEKIFNALQTEISTFWQNKITLISLARLWSSNLISNLPAYTKSSSLNSIKNNSPIIVCGAGPSLNDSISLLKEYRKYFFLLAVDTAYASLSAHQIKPDAILILEAQQINLNDFIYNLDRTIPVIADLTSSTAVLRNFMGPKLFFVSRYHDLNIFARLAKANLLPFMIEPLGSVGVTAVRVALELTTNHIFTVGLDFSYPNKKTHANGSPTHLLSLQKSTRLLTQLTHNLSVLYKRPLIKIHRKDGTSVLSDLVLTSYSKELRHLCSLHNGRIIDLSGQGILFTQTLKSLPELKLLLNKIFPSNQYKALPEIAIEDKHHNTNNFLTNEQTLISKMVRELQNSGQLITANLLDKLSYLFVHEPDFQVGQKNIGKSLSARMINHCNRINSHIEKVIKSLNQ